LALHAASINSAQLFTLDSPTTPALCLPPFATNFFSLFPQALLALRSAGHASVLEGFAAGPGNNLRVVVPPEGPALRRHAA
jgi:hypothetical protein